MKTNNPKANGSFADLLFITRLATFILALLAFACACGSNEVSDPVQIKYEVLTTSGNWYGEYIAENGERVCFCYPPWPDSGWTYSFNVTSKPFTLHIDASSEIGPGVVGAPDVTTNIYVDNKLVAGNTSNWAPGVASADYEVK
jgi:hypothetical protein